MRLNPFGARPAATTSPVSALARVTDRATAALDRDSAEALRAAKRSSSSVRDAAEKARTQNAAALRDSLAALATFAPSTVELLADEIDRSDSITRHSVYGRSPDSDSWLPAWLRDRCLRPDAEAVVLDWIAFGPLFVAHKELSATGPDDPLPQLHEAFGLAAQQSLSVDGVAAYGRSACERILHVAFALRDAQRTSVTRAIGSATGYAAADRWHAFDIGNRFVTAPLVEWIADAAPSDTEVATAIAAGRFSPVEFDAAAGRATGISPYDIDATSITDELRRVGA